MYRIATFPVGSAPVRQGSLRVYYWLYAQGEGPGFLARAILGVYRIPEIPLPVVEHTLEHSPFPCACDSVLIHRSNSSGGDISQFRHPAIVTDQTMSLESVKRIFSNHRIRYAPPGLQRVGCEDYDLPYRHRNSPHRHCTLSEFSSSSLQT